MPARIAETLADVRWQMRHLLERNHALPSLALTDIVEDRHGAWALHDAAVAGEVGQHRGHATLGHAAVLRTVGTIQSSGVVERRRFLVARRRRTVLAACAGRIAVLAGRGRLRQRKPERG